MRMARLPGGRNDVLGELVVRCVKKVADKRSWSHPRGRRRARAGRLSKASRLTLEIGHLKELGNRPPRVGRARRRAKSIMGVSPVSPLPSRAIIEILKTDIVRRAVGRLADIQRSFRKTGETPMILFARRQARAVLKRLSRAPKEQPKVRCPALPSKASRFSFSTAVNFWEASRTTMRRSSESTP
jgi:hypothetical protein